MGLEESDRETGINYVYSYAQDNPVNGTDPWGLTYWPIRNPGVPDIEPSQPVYRLVVCIATCYGHGFKLNCTTDSHPQNNPHTRGEAVDIDYPAKASDAKRILCCAAKCRAKYALDEKLHPSPNSNGEHIHVSTTTKGGRGDLPFPDSPECNPCD
jgi:hypothetical protein